MQKCIPGTIELKTNNTFALTVNLKITFSKLQIKQTMLKPNIIK